MQTATPPNSSRAIGPPSRVSRALAAVAYLFGAFSLIIVALGPKNPFLLRHAQQAMVLHMLRLVLVSVTMLTWYLTGTTQSDASISVFTLHLAMLVLVGLPWPSETPADLLIVLSLPLGGTWILAILASMISMLGFSLDLRALVSSRWPDRIDDSMPEIGTPEYDRRIGLRGTRPELEGQVLTRDGYSDFERRIARDLRANRLERMWSASRVAAQERNRSGLLQELEHRQQTVLVRLDHLNHLLSGGSISMSRYNRFNQELVEYLDTLRMLLARVKSRTDDNGHGIGELPETPPSLSGTPDAQAITLAVIDTSGIPVVTYGHFALDESLISGMVSVMDGLSEEMFGSRASMTQLADGEVVYFAQAAHSSAFATFDDEPSPVQVSLLRDYLDEFEAVNAAQLKRPPFDPVAIKEIEVPFQFVQPGSSAASVE